MRSLNSGALTGIASTRDKETFLIFLCSLASYLFTIATVCSELCSETHSCNFMKCPTSVLIYFLMIAIESAVADNFADISSTLKTDFPTSFRKRCFFYVSSS